MPFFEQNQKALDYLSSGKLDEAMEAFSEIAETCHRLSDHDGRQHALRFMGEILYEQGDLDGAMDLFKEQELICRQISDIRSLELAISCQIVVLRRKGDYPNMFPLERERELLRKQIEEKYGTLILSLPHIRP